MNLLWLLAFTLVPLSGLAYAGWHIWVLLPWPAWAKTVTIIAGVAAFLLLFAGILRAADSLPMPVARAVYNVGTSSIFVLLYIVMTFLVIDLGRLLRLVPRHWVYNNGTTAVVLTAFFVGLFTYGYLHYQSKYRQELHLTTAKPLPRPLKLVLASDLHLGYHNPRTELSRWIDLINREQPDAVLIAGDIIDSSIRPLIDERMAEEWHRIEAPVYACLGNHEYFSQLPAAQQFYSDAGITLLRDTAVTDTTLALTVIGRDDRTNMRRRRLADIVSHTDLSHYTILLDHQPYHLEEAQKAGIDFQFSGHTHRGQVWPLSWITDALYECSFGPLRKGDTDYYVSSGLGIWGGRFRIGTRSEYVVLTISN